LNVIQQKFRVNKVSSPQLTIEQVSAFIKEVRIFRPAERFVVYLSESLRKLFAIVKDLSVEIYHVVFSNVI
jgi:hypothetical protein